MKKSDIVKAWLGSAIQDFVSILKTGGWKVAALGVPVAAAGLTLTACQVEKIEVQVAQIDTLDQIQTLFGDSFSVAEQVEDAAKEKFGNNLVSLMSENANGAGKVVAFFKEDGQLKKATATLNLDAADFDAKIYGYNTFTKQGETLSFWQNGQEQEVDLSAPGVLYVIQGDGTLTVMNTTAVQNEIENAVDSLQIENLGLQTDHDEVGYEDLKTMLGFVIEQAGTAHLPTLTLEYDRASNQTTATYSYLSLAGQTKIESGNIVFEGNLIENDSLNRTAAEEQLQTERAVIRANRASVLEEATYTTLFELDNFDSNSVELEVAEKGDGNEDPGDNIPDPITFNSWEEVFELENGKVKDAIVKTLQDNLFSESVIKDIYGNDMTVADLSNGTIDLIKLGFDLQDGKIVSVNILGVRNGYPTEQSRRLRGANFALKQPISLASVVAKPVEDGPAYNQKSIYVNINNSEYLIDLSQIELASAGSSYTYGYVYNTTAEITDQEDLDFFKICMPLAVAAGKIGAETKLSFVSVQGNSGTTDDFGSVYSVVIKAVDLDNNQLYNYQFIFDDASTSMATSTVDLIKDAISRGQFRISDRGVEKIIPESDIMLEYKDEITEYTISQAEAEETN